MSNSFWIKCTLAILILASIAVTYYVTIVEEDYEIFFNEDGLPTLEEE